MFIFRCVCPEGFEGDECEINIDDCEDNDCENNSTCVDGINNYTCLCSPEYTGKSLSYTCTHAHTQSHAKRFVFSVLYLFNCVANMLELTC